MSYTKTTWSDGDIITANKMNNIETGVESLNTDVGQLQTDLDSLTETVENLPTGGGDAPADYQELVDDVSQLKADLSGITDDIYTKTLLTANSTSTGWKLKDNGFCEPDASCQMDKYQVTSGDTLEIISDGLFQFQTSSSVPSGGTLNRVGDTYGVGTFKMVVPESATYLIVSTTISNSNAAVYTLSFTIDDLIDDVNSISSHVGDIDKDLEKSKTYELAVQNLLGNDGAQIIDLSGLTPNNYGTSYKYYNILSVPFTVNGDYYPNPLGECSIIRIFALDENGNKLKYNGTNSDNFSVNAWTKFTRVNDRKIVRTDYVSESNFKIGKKGSESVLEYATDIAAVKIELMKNSAFNNPTDLGVTRDFPSNVYIPYGYAPRYNPWMIDAIWDGFVSDKKFYNVPAKRLNPWMQRSYAITDNLLDDRKIDWVGDGNYYKMKYGETVPVEGGRTIVCSKNMYTVRWYDENGTETSLSNGSRFTLPASAVAIRFDLWRGTGDTAVPIDEYQPVYLYYADSRTLYTYDDVDRNPVPMAQINGWDINKNVYDMAVPEVGSNIVRMMKTFAIRELNHQRNAFRIGTFNIYINNTRTNRSTIKKELETYGIDICCFQEARNLDDNNNQLNIGDYLKGWQFGYCNTNEMSTTSGSQTGRAMVSAYEVLSSEEVPFTDNISNSYLKCIIQLPRYKDYVDGLTTLSLYTYHGKVDSASTRTLEVTQMLTAIASDTSDFIIVTGDTNDFSANKDIWAQFQAAGLTPVHDGKSATVTDRSQTIDQIFVSSNITCLYYDVINSGEWMYKPTPTSNPQPVSDHDLLYADLQFDFETVLSARNSN